MAALRKLVPNTVATISIWPEKEGVKVAIKDPPVVPAVIVEPEFVPLRVAKVPPPLEVKMTVLSTLRPWLSLKTTFTVVVAPLAMGLLPKLMETLATEPVVLPKPVVVPLDKLSLLLVSPEEHPQKAIKTRTIRPQREIEAENLERLTLVPTGNIFVFSFPSGFVITTIAI
jgi:hypothetical protein